MQEKKPLRILFATEYLPPYVSGIANRCKNWIQGYKDQGHQVTVFSCKGTDCDVVVPSLANPFYNHQRYPHFNKNFYLASVFTCLRLAKLYEASRIRYSSHCRTAVSIISTAVASNVVERRQNLCLLPCLP